MRRSLLLRGMKEGDGKSRLISKKKWEGKAKIEKDFVDGLTAIPQSMFGREAVWYQPPSPLLVVVKGGRSRGDGNDKSIKVNLIDPINSAFDPVHGVIYPALLTSENRMRYLKEIVACIGETEDAVS